MIPNKLMGISTNQSMRCSNCVRSYRKQWLQAVVECNLIHYINIYSSTVQIKSCIICLMRLLLCFFLVRLRPFTCNRVFVHCVIAIFTFTVTLCLKMKQQQNIKTTQKAVSMSCQHQLIIGCTLGQNNSITSPHVLSLSEVI